MRGEGSIHTSACFYPIGTGSFGRPICGVASWYRIASWNVRPPRGVARFVGASHLNLHRHRGYTTTSRHVETRRFVVEVQGGGWCWTCHRLGCRKLSALPPWSHSTLQGVVHFRQDRSANAFSAPAGPRVLSTLSCLSRRGSLGLFRFGASSWRPTPWLPTPFRTVGMPRRTSQLIGTSSHAPAEAMNGRIFSTSQ